MTDNICKIAFLFILFFLTAPVVAQDYRPPSMDFDTQEAPVQAKPEIVLEQPSDVRTTIEVIEEPIAPAVIETKPLPKPSIPEQPRIKAAPKEIIQPAEKKQPVKTVEVEATPLEEPPVQKILDSENKDISIVIDFTESDVGLNQAQQAILKNNLEELKEAGSFHIHAYANTATTGNVGIARSLSLSRALTVREWFVKNGIDAKSMTLRALGQAKLGSDPLANSVEIFTQKSD